MIILEIKKILRRKECKAVTLVFFLAVVLDFLTNCYNSYGGKLTETRPAFVMTVLYNYSKSPFRMVFVLLLPLVISIVASDIFCDDHVRGINTYILTRVKRRKYIISQATAIFTVAFGIVFLSIILSVMLCIVAFPMFGYKAVAGWDLEMLVKHELSSGGFDNDVMLSALQMYHPYINILVGAILRAFEGGIFAVLSYGFSFCNGMNRYKVFFSSFVFYNVIDIIHGAIDNWFFSNNGYSLNLGGYFGICMMNLNPNVSTFSYVVGILLYILIALTFVVYGGKKQEI